MRLRQQPDRFPQTLQRVEALKGTRFDELAQWLRSFMETASVLPDNSEKRHDTIAYIANIIEKLPPSESRRFLFDAYLLQSTRESWNLESTSNVILIPTYAPNWGHEYYQLHPERYLSFVHVRDNLENTFPELLEYPWLIHELGHYIIKFEGKSLLENYTAIFNQELSQFKLRSGADRGIAKAISQRRIESYDEYWPESQWPREIMIDTIALWCCGPAYITTYYEEHQSLEPFVITPQHPPVELRTNALMYAANRLGWQNYIGGLGKLWADWNRDRQSTSEEYRNYNATRHLELMEASVDCALDFCQELSLPRLTPPALDRLKQAIHESSDVDGGIDLIVAARLVHQLSGDDAYDQWVTQQFELIA